MKFESSMYFITDSTNYAEEEFNPLQQKIEIKYPRDVIAENKVINILEPLTN